MSSVWMDPVELKATADVINAQAQGIRDTMAGMASACACEVPPRLQAWLEDELHGINTEALHAALGYLLEALDIALRANQIAADQSLVAAQAALPVPAAAFPLLGQVTTTTGMTAYDQQGAAIAAALLLYGNTYGGLPPGTAVQGNDISVVPSIDPAPNAFKDIEAIMKMGVPGGGASGGMTGDPNILADIYNGTRNTALNPIHGVIPGSHATNPLTGQSGVLSAGNTVPTSPGPPLNPPPRPVPSGP